MRTSSVIMPIFCQHIDNNYTFPFRYDKMVIIVANHHFSNNALQNVFRLIIVLTWILSAIGFTIIRLVFKKCIGHRIGKHLQSSFHLTLIDIFFNTFGLSLGTISKTKSNSFAESILILFITFFALLASLILSGLFISAIYSKC